MAEPKELKSLKRSIPPDLQKKVEDIQIKVERTTGPPGDLDEERKRWLIVGICLHSIISPLLRKYVDPIMKKLYTSLVSSDSIDTQGYHRYLKKYPNANRYYLNYESINNNRNVPKKKINNKWVNDYQNYDYKVMSHVDLSKLFLLPNMALYSAFDGTCDSSALTGMVFSISSFPSAVQTAAEKIRSDIRNRWAHCDFTEWTTAKYKDSFDLMGQLVGEIGLSNREENTIRGELNTWATNGQKYFSGGVLGLEIVEEMRQHTHILSEYVQTLCTSADSQFIRVQKELKNLKHSLEERIKNLEHVTEEHAVTLRELKTEMQNQNNDHIPKNIRAQHRQEISEWELDQTSFLVTRATLHILKSLPLNNCIVITGSSGCGKSANTHHVALHLRDKYGYEIVPVLTGPSDIINYKDGNNNQVFVVDDICGKETINIQSLQSWRDYSERLEKTFKTVENETNNTISQISGSKLLISCRLHIYKEEQFQLVKLLTRKECNLLSPDMCLLQEERTLMLQKYIPDTWYASVMKFEKNVDFFPLLCKMSKNKTSEEVIELFTTSIDYIKKSINHIILGSNDQSCALVLCILFDDGFNTNWLNLKSAPEKKKEKLESIVKEFKIDLYIESSRNALRSGFYTLDGTYLKQRGAENSMIHDKIQEMAAAICGQRRPVCFIKFSSSLFIRDHFIFKSVMEEQQTDDVIVLSKDTEEEYFERLLSDLKELNIISTFNNKQLIFKPFRDKLISFFGKSDEAKNVLKILGSKRCVIYRDHKIVDHCFLEMFTTPLIESASCGYLELVQFLVTTVKCNVNFTDERHQSSLLKASEGGKTDVVQFLCENKAIVSQCNMYGQSPLYAACYGGHIETVKMLLQNKADVSHCKAFGTCPLYVACAGGFVEIVKLLCQNSTEVLYHKIFGGSFVECVQGHIYTVPLSRNKIDRHRKSPLYVACKGGYIELIRLLLLYNYDVTIDNIGETPLFAACAEGHTEIVKVLLDKNADISQGDSLGNWSKLRVACAGGYTDIVKLLLQKNENVHQFKLVEFLFSLYMACQNGLTDIVEQLILRNDDLSTTIFPQRDAPFFVACSRGHTDTVHLLLQNKADVSQCNFNGVSPLCVACKGGYTDTAELLLQNNADVSKCNKERESPLYVACTEGHMNTVNLLLQKNADVAQCNINGKSPLYVACQGGHTDTAQLLLQKNAHVAQCDNNGGSPLHVACQGGHTYTAELLLQNNADVFKCNISGESPLFLACKGGYLNTLKLLLQKKADFSQCNAHGVSPLHAACEGGHTDIVELLLQNNADVSQCNVKGESSLYMACRGGHVNTVKLLLQNKASVSQCDQYGGRSPLHIVCDRRSLKDHLKYYTYDEMQSEFKKKYLDHIEIVKLLITGNADINLCNEEAQTPLDIARKSEFIEIVKLLEESLNLKTQQPK